MNFKFSHEEYRAAMILKKLSIIDIAEKLNISRRTIDYFIKGEMGMKKADEFCNLLNPELEKIHKMNQSLLRNNKKFQRYEENQ